MIVKFNNQYLQDIYQNRSVGGKPKFDNSVIKKFKKFEITTATILMKRFENLYIYAKL